jgi:hypothetical protein
VVFGFRRFLLLRHRPFCVCVRCAVCRLHYCEAKSPLPLQRRRGAHTSLGRGAGGIRNALWVGKMAVAVGGLAGFVFRQRRATQAYNLKKNSTKATLIARS